MNFINVLFTKDIDKIILLFIETFFFNNFYKKSSIIEADNSKKNIKEINKFR